MIKEFDPVIYPYRLWVAIKPTEKSIQEKFHAIDDNGYILDDNGIGDTNACTARCYPVGDKITKQRGLLIAIYRTKEFTIGTIAHEASHVADYFCEHLGITHTGFNDGEASAYITDWAAMCIAECYRPKLKH